MINKMVPSRKTNKADVVITTNNTTRTETTTSDVLGVKTNQSSEEKIVELQRRIEVIESVLRANPKINFDKLASRVAE